LRFSSREIHEEGLIWRKRGHCRIS
jgi:hypothetical protein